MRKAILSICFAVALAAKAMSAAAEELRIGTATSVAHFTPSAQGISNLVNKYAGGDITMVPVVTGGSVQNPRPIGTGEVDIAITNNNLAVLATKGVGPYKSGAIDVKAIAALHPSVLHMIVLDGSDIKGKRVAVGPAGGGTLGFLNFLLPIHSLTLDDFTPSFLSYADGFSQLSDGNVDAAFALSGYPASAVMQAGAGQKLRFIEFAPGKLDEALGKNAAFKVLEIPADVCGTDAAGTVIGVNNILIALTDMDADKGPLDHCRRLRSPGRVQSRERQRPPDRCGRFEESRHPASRRRRAILQQVAVTMRRRPRPASA